MINVCFDEMGSTLNVEQSSMVASISIFTLCKHRGREVMGTPLKSVTL